MDKNYQEIATEARKKVLELIFNAKTSHIGSNLSCIDILSVLFEKIDLDKDKFILSKGWAAAALYYFLWRKGRITEDDLNSFCQPGSKWIGLTEPIHPDISFGGGSMGMGLPAAVGFALAKKLKGEDGKIYVLMSDGEMQCGTTWESALIAAHHKLDNLIVIVDYNGLQAMGETEEILNIEPFIEKWSAFGWQVCASPRLDPTEDEYADGHNFVDIQGWLDWPQVGPKINIFKTIKGKGISFMENNNRWHYLHISDEDYKKAMNELTKK